MSEIPKDIEKAGEVAFYAAWDAGHSGPVATAILAERKRCAEIARKYDTLKGDYAGASIAKRIEAGT